MAFIGLRLGNEPEMSSDRRSRVSTKSDPADVQSLASLAEELGYEEVWMTEGSGRDSLTQLTAIAAATNRIRLGTGILPMFSRTPLITAMSAAGLSAVSDGRFILGLGVGNRTAVEDGHGVAYRRPIEHLRDMIQIVRGLLRGEEVSYRGKAITVSRASLGGAAPQGKVPIYIAALGPRMLQLAGEMADGVLLSWTAASYLEQAVQLVRDGATKAGRDPSEVEISGYLRVAVTRDPAAGRASLQREDARYAGGAHYRSYFENTGFDREMEGVELARDHADDPARAAAIGENMQRELGVVGSAEECRARLDELRKMGLAKPVIAPLPVGDLKGSYERTIRALAP
ncbi:MAG: LLM class flavin-dependent oxidoreductase [Chloroflexi bacterium]|nr:LLM class flavin-dependent oxidoreductase [Chloroflexota bacterium]